MKSILVRPTVQLVPHVWSVAQSVGPGIAVCAVFASAEMQTVMNLRQRKVAVVRPSDTKMAQDQEIRDDRRRQMRMPLSAAKGLLKGSQRQPASQHCAPSALRSSPSPPPRAPALDNPDIKDVLPFPARSSNNKPEKFSGPKMLQTSFSQILIHHDGTDRVELPVGSGILSEKAMRDPRYEWTKTQSGLAGGGRSARVGVGHDAPSTIETIETER